MTELEKMERARMYLDKLANGIDPITDEELPGDTVLNNVRLARCFFYSADILRRVIENGGEIKAAKKPKLAAFTITQEQKAAFQFSSTPLRISEIVDRLNASVEEGTVKKLSTTAITGWLVEKGFLCDVMTESGKKVRRPTEQGIEIGLSSEERQTMQGRFTVVLYNQAAQQFILDNLEAILEPKS